MTLTVHVYISKTNDGRIIRVERPADTMQSLFDEIDVIEYYQYPGKANHLSEITEKQHKLFELMDVYAPT